MAGSTAAAATAVFEVGSSESAAAVDNFTVVGVAGAAVVIEVEISAAGAAEELDNALKATTVLGIAVHRFPPIDVIKAPTGRDILKGSNPALEEKSSRIKRTKGIQKASKPSKCYHYHFVAGATRRRDVVKKGVDIGILKQTNP